MSKVAIYKAKYFNDMIYTYDQDEPEFRFVKLSDYKTLEKAEHYANNVVVPTVETELTAAQAEIAALKKDRDMLIEAKNFINFKNHALQSALDVAVEFIESISIRELDSQNVLKRISALEKIKQIRGKE